jgi:hypothetical protein
MMYRGICGGFMKSRYIGIFGLLISLILFTGALPASAGSNDRYVRLRYLEGDVTIYPEDGQRPNDATINSPVLDGDVVETANGRAELSFRNGVLIRLGDYSSARFVSTYSPMSIELVKGTLFVDSHIVQSFRDELEIRAADAQVYLINEGNLRIDLGDQGGVRVTTIQGEAEVRASGQRVLLRDQERTYIDTGNAPDAPQAFNEGYDELDDWNASRMNSMASTDTYGDEQQQPYVDQSLYYDTYDLQDYGDWRYYGTYGNVWVPHVSVGWRPYYDGRWSYSPGGWFWVSYEPWGWAPYHYGRWGWAIDFGWYWIPGYTFAPSWVSWYDYGDYIGWCPLNYYNRPIYWGNWNNNYYNNPVQKQKAGGIGVDNSWTFVKKHDIGTGSVKKISVGSNEVKKIHFDDSKITRSPEKQLTSYVIPKNVKTPAYVNDARIAPAKSPDIKSPIGVNHKEEWPGRKNVDTDKNKSVDTNKNSDPRAPSSKQWNTRPATTPKSTAPSSPKTTSPPPSSSKSINKDPGSSSSNKNSNTNSNKSNSGGSNDKKVSKPQPPNYMNRDEQFERLRSTHERDTGWPYRKETSSPYQRYESPTRKSPYDSEFRSPWYRNPNNDSRDRESEVSPRYYEGARKMLERLEESKSENRQPSTVSPRSEPKSAPRYEQPKSRPSNSSRSMKSSSPSRKSSPPSSRPVKKKD